MKIHILCVTSQNSSAVYPSGFNATDEISKSNCSKNIFLLENKLKSIIKSDEKPDIIVIRNAIKNELSFRKLFAGIIYRGEKSIQENPKNKAKKLLKEKSEEKTFTYYKKQTHIFKIESENKTSYAFNYMGTKILVLGKNVKQGDIYSLIQKSQELFDESQSTYPDGYSLIEKTHKVLTFKEKNIPSKSDSLSELVRKFVRLLAFSVFVIAFFSFLYNIIILPVENSIIQGEIQTIFYEDETDPKTGEQVPKTKNWSKLKKINKEIIGWIKLDNTKINYPVVWHKSDNEKSQYYLYRNYKGQPSGYGSIFMDYRSTKGLNSKNAIIHGHHMDDGSMFSDLMKYGNFTGNLAFYKKTPTIEISTEKGGTETYKIFSIFKSNVLPEQGEYFDFYCNDFESDAQFMNYVYNLQIRSLITTNINVNEKDKLLTLVTCSYEFDEFRTVIVARKCRKNESAYVDTKKASIPPTSLWPQIYYSTYKRTRPAVSTFQQAYSRGETPWYDGKNDLSGDEELPTSIVYPTEATVKRKPKYYSVQIYNGDKLIKISQVKENKEVKLPKLKKSYTENGYKYTFKKWSIKGSRSYKKITQNSIVSAIYSKTKIKVKNTTATTKATTKPKPTTSPTKKPTETTSATETTEETTERETETENGEQ